MVGVVGGIGGDLIAEQVQRWKDRADRVEEAEVAAWAEEAPQNPDLRQALDDMLERLDAIPQAQAGLGEDDRRWLTETLQAELVGLGSLARFEAALSAPRTLVQSGGVLVKGDVKGDVVTARKVTAFDQRGQTVGRQVNVVGDGAEPDEPA